MPTGYTADVQSGKVTTLREFAMQCSRAFGFLVTMRDADQGAPIPERFEPSTKYHDEALEKARSLLAEVSALSFEECDTRAEAEYQAALAQADGWRREREGYRARYEAMLGLVKTWRPPAEFEGMKEFMLSQLRESIDFDCRAYSNDTERLSAEKWKAKTLKEAARDIGYHEKERAEEISRVAERNRYLALLRQEFPTETREAA